MLYYAIGRDSRDSIKKMLQASKQKELFCWKNGKSDIVFFSLTFYIFLGFFLMWRALVIYQNTKRQVLHNPLQGRVAAQKPTGLLFSLP